MLLWTGGRVAELTSSVVPDHWRRYLGFVLDGLRAEAATALPRPALTRRQLDRVPASEVQDDGRRRRASPSSDARRRSFA